MPAREIPQELLKRAKSIPARVLKAEVGERGKKGELIRALFRRDSEKLRDLADIYELKRERSLFLFKTPGKPRVSLDDLSATRRQINRVLESGRQQDEPKFEVARISRVGEGGDLVLQVRYQKQKHVDHEWEGVIHTHRDTQVATVGLNIKDNYAVVHTRSSYKALACIVSLGTALFGGKESVTQVVPTIEEQEEKFGPVRPKRATIDGLTLPGTREINLKGEDVKKTVKVLSRQYDLDFEKLGGSIKYESSETKKQVKFGADGRLVFPSAATDHSKVIKRILK